MSREVAGSGLIPVIRDDFAGHFSDSGNATRFVRDHTGKVLYCTGIGWLHYDGIRWCPAGNQITKRAKQTIAKIYVEASKAPESRRKPIAAHALRSESAKGIQNMLALAECEMPVDANELDKDPWLLNCLNGTLNLQTGRLQPHNSADRITKVAPVHYDLLARSDLWDMVLERALPDEEVRDYFRNLTGYTLTGCTGEDIFVLIHGPSRTSKGTIQEAIASTLGDYAITAELDVFAQRNKAGGPRPELTRLQGARMVSVYETSKHMALSASLVKTLAGSDPITARDLYSKPVTFKPVAKIWVATNHLPNVPADDGALWERIRAIPFDVTISEQKRDRTVRSRLQEPEHKAAILAWAVIGCRKWQADGRLLQPDTVRKAGLAYRESMDPIGRFVRECYELDPNLWISSAELRAEYEEWCQGQGEPVASVSALTWKLRDLGCTPQTLNRQGGRGWKGIGKARPDQSMGKLLQSFPIGERGG